MGSKASAPIIVVAVFVAVFQLSGEVRAGGGAISPERSLSVLTLESWGCPAATTIVADVTASVSLADGISAELAEAVPAEDFVRRPELLIIFPPGAAAQVPGSLVLNIHIQSQESPGQGRLFLDRAELVETGDTYYARLLIRFEGELKANLLYGRSPGLMTTLSVCPEGGLNEPSERSFFFAYEVAKNLEGSHTVEGEGWKEVRFNLDRLTIDRTRLVDNAAEVLVSLEEKFSTSVEYGFVWEEAGADAAGRGQGAPDTPAAHLVVSLRGSADSSPSPSVGDVLLRQPVTLKGVDGRIIAAEILIGRPGLRRPGP